MARTVYVLEPGANPKEPPRLKPVQVKLGITDGTATEVLDGIEEGAQVVTGIISTVETASRPVANPFSGGRRF